MKVFISQPMNNKTKEEIIEEREKAIDNVRKLYPREKIEIIDSILDISDEHNALYYLGKSFELLSEADLAYFIGDWEKYRGCRMENLACKQYGMKFIMED